ncbi:MAG: sporulation initiation factor Spo0A C-terminal domain-containing protein [Christensenellales bacterium]|jgi:hypothetical protein
MVRRTGKETDVYEQIYDNIAKEYGVLPNELKKEMQETIDASWNNEDEEVTRTQKSLFPNGKPTVEEFIKTIALVISLDAAAEQKG